MKIILITLLIVTSFFEVNAQEINKDFIELNSFKYSGNKTLATYSYKDKKIITKFELIQKNKNLVVLKNLTTNKIVEEYKQVPPHSAPTFTCEEQIKQQEDTFRLNTLPIMIREANRQCRTVRFCYTYYCDGVPNLFVLYMAKPTNWRCQIRKLDFAEEKLKYAFAIKK
jgi:hypothetical protein